MKEEKVKRTEFTLTHDHFGLIHCVSMFNELWFISEEIVRILKYPDIDKATSLCSKHISNIPAAAGWNLKYPMINRSGVNLLIDEVLHMAETLSKDGVIMDYVKDNLRVNAMDFQSWFIDICIALEKGRETKIFDSESEDIIQLRKEITSLTERVKMAKEELKTLHSKAEFFDLFISKRKPCTISEFCVLFGFSSDSEIIAWLDSKGYLYTVGQYRLPTQKALEEGLLVLEAAFLINPTTHETITYKDGSRIIAPVLKITAKGQAFFYNEILTSQQK